MSLRDSILKTIAFFDLFDFPLTPEEIKEYLYGYQNPLHIKELKGVLKEMAEGEYLENVKEFYILKGRGEIIGTRRARKFIAEKLWNRVTLYAQYLRHLPFIRLIAVCNNLSADNVTEESDIDLFIVIKKGRLWTGRLFTTLLLHLFGVWRHGAKIAGRFCLSFFVTEERINIGELELRPEDPYLAYWTQLLAPVEGRQTYEQFKAINAPWLKEKYGLSFLPSAMRHLGERKESLLKRFLEWLLNGFLGNSFEKLLQKTWKKKTLARQRSLGPEAGVIIGDDILKFHDHDRRKEYFEKWKEVVKTLSPKSEIAP